MLLNSGFNPIIELAARLSDKPAKAYLDNRSNMRWKVLRQDYGMIWVALRIYLGHRRLTAAFAKRYFGDLESLQRNAQELISGMGGRPGISFTPFSAVEDMSFPRLSR